VLLFFNKLLGNLKWLAISWINPFSSWSNCECFIVSLLKKIQIKQSVKILIINKYLYRSFNGLCLFNTIPSFQSQNFINKTQFVATGFVIQSYSSSELIMKLHFSQNLTGLNLQFSSWLSEFSNFVIESQPEFWRCNVSVTLIINSEQFLEILSINI